MMKLGPILIRVIFCGILMLLLLFCNKPTVQRGPEQDSISSPVDMNKTKGDSTSRPDSTINKPVDDSIR